MSKQAWTTADIPDQRGRLAIVTGANSGIGFETAKALAMAGADVILATRNAEKGAAAVDAIRKAEPTGSVVREALDLSRLDSVAAFSEARHADGRPIDLLINNAGIMALPERQVTVDGFEMQLGTNHLGHFALTASLFDVILAAPNPRVVSLSSGVHRAPTARIHLDDLQLANRYDRWSAYGQSKVACLMFALELDRRARDEGWNVMSNAAHPGSTQTNLQTTGPAHGKESGGRWLRVVMSLPGCSQQPPDGALPTLYAATSPDAVGGGYYGPSRLFEMIGPPKPAHIARKAKDEDVARRLWEESEKLTGARFAAPAQASPA